MMTDKQRQMLTVDAAAALKGVHPETLRRALRRGEFRRARAISSGQRKTWLLDAEEIEEWRPRPAGRPKRGGSKMNLVVKAQLPVAAHLAMPPDTPAVVISRHRATRRGAQNAWVSLHEAQADYVKSHGNAAARAVWIERSDGVKFARWGSPDLLDFEVEYDIDRFA